MLLESFCFPFQLIHSFVELDLLQRKLNLNAKVRCNCSEFIPHSLPIVSQFS